MPAPITASDSSIRVIENARDSNVEEIIVEADPNRWSELRAFVAELRVLPTPVAFVPVGALSEMFRRPNRDLGSTVCVEVQRGPLTFLECAIKRFTDLVGAGLALVILSPLLAAVVIAIKLELIWSSPFQAATLWFQRSELLDLQVPHHVRAGGRAVGYPGATGR